MNQSTRIVNAKTTTKAELIQLNAALAADNAALRGLNHDLQDALAREAVKHIITKLPEQPVDTGSMLNLKAKALALKLHAQTRVRNNDIEVYLHGGWNSVNTIAIPEYA